MTLLPSRLLCCCLLWVLLLGERPEYEYDLLRPEHGQLARQWNVSSAELPRVLWVSRDSSSRNWSDASEVDEKTTSFYSRQVKAGWSIRIIDNAGQRAFMETNFQNTTVLWAFRLVHPLLGAARADLWRYATLYLHGGVYFDYDACLESSLLDDVWRGEGASLVLTSERSKNKFEECFVDSYPLSEAALARAHGRATYEALARHSPRTVITNWGFLVSPGHPFLLHMLSATVDVLRREYHRRSAMTDAVYSEEGHSGHKQRFRQVLCATGPNLLSHALRAFLLRRNLTDVTSSATGGLVSVTGSDFAKYGGTAKLGTYSVKGDASHFGMVMRNASVRLLATYAPLPLRALENACITTLRRSKFWVVSGARLRPFRDWDQFTSNCLHRNMFTALHDDDLGAFPQGPPLEASFNLSVCRLRLVRFNPRNVMSTASLAGGGEGGG